VKKYISFLACTAIVLASEIPMPPSMPSINMTKHQSKNKELKNKTDNKQAACEIIPPMLTHLPPMLEDDLDKCKNELNLPSKKIAEKQLKKMLKKDIKVKKISALNGFSMLYKIESNKGVFYCNRYINSCLRGKIQILKEKTNRKKVK